jgi:hypothetical protein
MTLSFTEWAVTDIFSVLYMSFRFSFLYRFSLKCILQEILKLTKYCMLSGLLGYNFFIFKHIFPNYGKE